MLISSGLLGNEGAPEGRSTSQRVLGTMRHAVAGLSLLRGHQWRMSAPGLPNRGARIHALRESVLKQMQELSFKSVERGILINSRGAQL